MPITYRLTIAMPMAFLCWLSASLFMLPHAIQAEPVPPMESEASPPTEESDEDADPHLVPVESELGMEPVDLGPASDQSDQADQAEEAANSSEESAPLQESVYNIPVEFDPIVESHIHFFNTSIRDRFEEWLARLNHYRPLVESIFAEFELPSDLVNLSLVESGFNPYAYSRAKATGPWQFMKATGKHYGLRIDQYVDERRDPIKSTVAAARYLRDLYDLFGTWPLAMAAYNAGEGKVLRALQKSQAETFSDIAKTKWIRRETKQYVPRIMAATIIARNPERYGFEHHQVPPYQFEEVVVDRPLHFRAIANITGISFEDLRRLNPELRRDATPPDDSSYHLKVPVGTGMTLVNALDRIPTYKFPPLRDKGQHVKAGSSRWYRARAGNPLEKVSKRLRVPVKTLKTRNGLTKPLVKTGGRPIIPR